MPPQRRLRTRIKQMDRIQLLEYIALSIVLVIALIAIIAAFTLSGMGGNAFRAAQNINWEQRGNNTGLPLQDTDGDGLGDIEENYKFGTNITNADTDGDGMTDGWEVHWMLRDIHTGEWLLDPNDPTDAYSDPDNDGYDFDHNGYINGSEQDRTYSGYDWVYLSKLKVPAHSDYTTYNLNLLLSNLEEHKGELVRIPRARVVDNGSYNPDEGGYGTQIDRPIMISITDESTSQQLMVCMTGRSNRPINLYDDNSLPAFPADIVDVQGIFLGEGVDFRIECRGTEKFTNLMEYLATQDYNNDRDPKNRDSWNETDPLSWDTDMDMMSDGWEVHYGQGLLNTSMGIPRWEWIVKLDPTSPDDAYGESNPAMTDLDNDRIQVPDPETGEQKWVGYNRDEYMTIKDAELSRLMSPSRRNLADMLGIPDLNRSWYAYGMDPAMPDSDLDSYDVDNDGPTPGVDTNANDFNEIFYSNTNPISDDTDGDTMKDGWEIHFGLNATNPNDRFDDPDGDQLQNYMEFQSRTNPRRWDTDDEANPRRDPNAIFDDPTDPSCYDGMPDGWEVFYRLDPLNRNDWNHDDDVIDIAGVPVSRPDGLINLLEYYNNTDPKNPDTDGDHLSDYEEIAIGWDVRVNSKVEHYYTCASRYGGMDTDKDTSLGPGLPPEGAPPGPAGTEFLNPGDEDTRHDLNDWNEVVYYRTNASNPDSDGDGLSDGTEMFTDLDVAIGMQATDPCLIDTDGDTLNDNVEVGGLKLWLPDNPVPQRIVTSPLRLDTDNDGLKDGDEVRNDFKPRDITGALEATIRLVLQADGLFMPTYDPDIGERVDTCNPIDPDTDKDGIPDGYEFDFSDPDCDGLPTYWEQEYGFGRLNAFKQDTDGNQIPDMSEDFDGDGFNNLEEYRHRTDPLEMDSAIPGLEAPPGMTPKTHAHNGIKDSDEGMIGNDKSQPFKDQWGHSILLRQPIYSDSDGDLMPDWWEIVHKLNPHANDSGDDADNDGFANIDEYVYNTNPETSDSDKDGTADWQDHPFTYSPFCTDRDRDGIGDWWEKYWFTSIEACDPNGNPDGPYDEASGLYGDNWTNFQEWYNSPAGWENNLFRTNPKLNDTDGDGINDDADPYPVRIPYVSSPMNPTDLGSSMNPVLRDPGEGDMDHDGMSNIEEYKYPFGTLDPTDPDSDADIIPDGWEVAMGIPTNITGNNSGITNGTIDTIMKPLDGAGDTLTDPDIDGVNYSLKWVDLNGNKWPDSGEFIITEYDANGDGMIDPFFENESLSNMEEYWFGKDCDADGIMENTTYPFANDTDHDGMLDGYELGFSDADDDGMPNIYELKWGLNPLDPDGNNGSLADIDNDGFTNWQEIWNNTNPRDPADFPLPMGRSGVRAVPQSMRSGYELALMLENYLVQHPKAADPSFLQDIRAFLGHFR